MRSVLRRRLSVAFASKKRASLMTPLRSSSSPISVTLAPDAIRTGIPVPSSSVPWNGWKVSLTAYSAAPMAASAISARSRRNQRLGLGAGGGRLGRPGRPIRWARAARDRGGRSATAWRPRDGGSGSAASPLREPWYSGSVSGSMLGLRLEARRELAAGPPGGSLLRRALSFLGCAISHYSSPTPGKSDGSRCRKPSSNTAAARESSAAAPARCWAMRVVKRSS